MLTVTFDAVVEVVGRCAEFLPYLRSMADCWFVHDFSLIICYFDGSIDDFRVIIPSLCYVFFSLIVHLFWRLPTALSLKLISVLVVWSVWIGLAENSARR